MTQTAESKNHISTGTVWDQHHHQSHKQQKRITQKGRTMHGVIENKQHTIYSQDICLLVFVAHVLSIFRWIHVTYCPHTTRGNYSSIPFPQVKILPQYVLPVRGFSQSVISHRHSVHNYVSLVPHGQQNIVPVDHQPKSQ